MTALTSTQINAIDKMNEASRRAGGMGTRLNTLETNMVVAGSHVVTAAQASASAITIQTAVAAIEGRIVNASRSGSNLAGVKSLTTGSNINITSASPASWVIAADDQINYIVW